MFVCLITDNFLEDAFCQMMQDELIMTTICNGDERLKGDTGVSNTLCKQNSTGHQGYKCHIIIKNHVYVKYDGNTPHSDPR